MPLLLETPTPTTTLTSSITADTPGELWAAFNALVLPLALPAAEATLVAVVTILLARWLRVLVRASLARARTDRAVIPLVSQLVYFAVIALGASWVLAILNVPLTGVIATFGAVSIAFGLSLQDLLRNLIAGIYLLVEKPFSPGDRLKIRTFEGIVDSVDIRTTTLLTTEGERVLVPNAVLFAEVMVNRGVPPPQVELEQAEEGPVG
jgi:small conductance mechanosensitive channel